MTKSTVKGGAVLLGCKPNNANNNEKDFASIRTGTLASRVNNELDELNLHKTNNYVKSHEDLTLSVQNVCKCYEPGKPVLSNLSMNVKRGTIYGLLGSSGCGKTTALSCIVGLTKWDSGEILLFGKRPNGVPGRRVGFMPQDIALYDQISIRETIGYYGRLYGMAVKEVDKQWVWLSEFLQLPSKFKLIKDLSGGQKRRTSLAVALVHSPDLLILDEPTVGLDPLLRVSIWEHLLKMVESRKTTIIVTTHYIEEARFSNTIGVMRKGKLLVEDSPEALLQQHECQFLEQVVLKLCRKDEQAMGKRGNDNGLNNNITEVIVYDGKMKSGKGDKSSKSSYNVYEKFQENWQQRRSSVDFCRLDEDNKQKQNSSSSSIFDRIRASSTVLWLLFMRHPVFMTMVLFLPTLQMILTLAVLGTHPKDLKFGVVNQDTLAYDTCFNMKSIDNGLTGANSSCNFQNLSCSLITELSRSGTLTLVPTQSTELAREQVRQGDLWGYFLFPTDYSQHLANLVVENKFAENETLEGSRVHLTMDMSNYLGAAMAIQDAFESYESFAKRLATSCGLDPREFQLPMMFREPVYGRNDNTFQEYVIPIVILTVIFEIPMLVTSILFINDRKQGTLDRARVAGLRFKEVMISHFLTQGSVIIGQTAICSIVMHFLYTFRVAGYYWHYFFLIVLGGLCGEALGLLLGVIFREEVESVMFGIFLGPILLMYEGAIWPLEGMTKTVRQIAYTTPTTLMVESIRGVIYRGVGLFHEMVWPGIAVLVGWTVLFWIVSISVFIRKQK